MKSLAIQLIAVTILLTSSVSIFAQDVLTQKIQITKLALENEGYTIVDGSMTSMKRGETAGDVRTFYAGYDYYIVVLGSKGISDLDLYLYDSNANLMLKDVGSGDDGVAILEFRALFDENYYIAVDNYDTKKKRKTYEMAIVIAAKPSSYGHTTYNY